MCACAGTVAYGRRYYSGKPGSGTLASIYQVLKTTPGGAPAGALMKHVDSRIKCYTSNFADVGEDPAPNYYKQCLCQKGKEWRRGSRARGHARTHPLGSGRAAASRCHPSAPTLMLGSPADVVLPWLRPPAAHSPTPPLFLTKLVPDFCVGHTQTPTRNINPARARTTETP